MTFMNALYSPGSVVWSHGTKMMTGALWGALPHAAHPMHRPTASRSLAIIVLMMIGTCIGRAGDGMRAVPGPRRRGATAAAQWPWSRDAQPSGLARGSARHRH